MKICCLYLIILIFLKISLKRSKSCGVSSTPGFTKNIQEIQIDSKVKVLDCPGVIFDDK